MEGFLKYLDVWKASVDSRENFTPAQKQRMLLSCQTIEGLKITGESSMLVQWNLNNPNSEGPELVQISEMFRLECES